MLDVLHSIVIESTPPLRRRYDAFLRDLPSLLSQYQGQWAAYAGDQRLGIGPSKRDLYRQCTAAGHRPSDLLICGIEQPQQVVLDQLFDV
jgi:hypothetical protein